ncbi:MAG: hypothetical protein VB934_09530 [Polyangiaceae bacterium]
MKTLWYGVALATAALVMACSAEESDATAGSGGSGGAASSTTATATSTTTSSATSSVSSTGSGGASGGICGNPDYSYDDLDYDACVSATCCDSFNACVADVDCDTCIGEPDAVGCDANSLFTAYDTCISSSCPEGVCDTEITEATYECNGCVSENCCGDAQVCVGDGSEVAVDLCLECMNDPDGAACSDSAIQTAAKAYNACAEANCQSECYE